MESQHDSNLIESESSYTEHVDDQSHQGDEEEDIVLEEDVKDHAISYEGREISSYVGQERHSRIQVSLES
jgi:hypothetical protein